MEKTHELRRSVRTRVHTRAVDDAKRDSRCAMTVQSSVLACRAAMTGKLGKLERWTRPESKSRRLLVAAFVYVVSTSAFATVAGAPRLIEHTQYNHYAHLADAWLHGRQDLAHGPPGYAQMNDFGQYEGKWYITFPPLPAALMLPFVKLAGSPENFRDGQFVIWIAGFVPAFVFFVLEKLRRTGRSPRTEGENVALSFLFAFGTVYFFTAVEGFVWYAALVVGTAASALYVLYALDAERPLLAGAMMGCAYLSRPTVLLLSLLFVLEAVRVSCRDELPSEGRPFDRMKATLHRLDASALARRLALFAVPILAAFGVVALQNWTRYGRATPVYFDHQYLTVAWHERMLKWGMFSYHFLAKNLAIALTSMPWLPPSGGASAFGAPFKINEHGLALWFTTPFYFWLLWPNKLDRGRSWLYAVAALTAALPAGMNLLYQNSGWRQFGYRFSCDYAVLLFVMLAVGARPVRRWLFGAAAAWSVGWNLFGAATFDKGQFDRFYFRDGSQTIVYQPD